MTIDQVFMLLSDKRYLRKRGSKRVAKMGMGEVRADEDGVIRGRAADGTPIKGRFTGKSKAQMLREKHAAEKAK